MENYLALDDDQSFAPKASSLKGKIAAVAYAFYGNNMFSCEKNKRSISCYFRIKYGFSGWLKIVSCILESFYQSLRIQKSKCSTENLVWP